LAKKISLTKLNHSDILKHKYSIKLLPIYLLHCDPPQQDVLGRFSLLENMDFNILDKKIIEAVKFLLPYFITFLSLDLH